ncbi:hypothetical protein Ciccas_007500 [Cichlidogyrus casuarinus]|uniref:deoxyhypusine synthase n=1 Tax=Cichlidogyrus casuarinus TaxID=1844966 RepID=A0ABD2Q2R0_9PLAT
MSSPKNVIGVVVENIKDKDLYIDFGGKFLAVCDCPPGEKYPRGSLVRIKLFDMELTQKFMLNRNYVTIREADAKFIGPYQGTSADELPPGFADSVLKPSSGLPSGVRQQVKGYDFNDGLDFAKLFDSLLTTGFQATHFGEAVNIVNEMLAARAKAKLTYPDEDRPFKLFFAYTSNMISSGVRESIRFLAEHNMIDAIVTTAGGIEEDFIKCLRPSFIGSFSAWPGEELRAKGINRIGNLLVPNDNYVEFEKWIHPILDQLLKEQIENKVSWTPSKVIDRLGEEINNPDSVYYWCHKNKIPVYCPALTDGSIGDMFFSHGFKDQFGEVLRLDIVEDLSLINRSAIFAKETGMLILGGGLIKHHTFNANLMRNGADYTVLINTAAEFDGSDAGASPDEAVSWGKIRGNSKSIKVHADASLVFPLMVARTFAKQHLQAPKQ